MIDVEQGRPTIDWNKMSDLKSKWESAAARTLQLQSKGFIAKQGSAGINNENQSERKILLNSNVIAARRRVPV